MSDSHSSDDTQGVPGAGATPAGATSAPQAAATGSGPAAKVTPKRWYIVHTYSGQEARAKQIDLTVKLTAEPCRVFADRDMIHQAVLNLVSNAIKYTLEHGKVSVEVGRDETGASAWLKVKDNGVGIGESDLPFIYDKFYRVADHKRLAKGTGLGLPLVKHVIETVHCGKLTVTSEVDKGSTFMFTLPVIDQG